MQLDALQATDAFGMYICMYDWHTQAFKHTHMHIQSQNLH